MKPDSDWKYWNDAGSVDMAKYDIPAFIDAVIEETKVESVTVIALD